MPALRKLSGGVVIASDNRAHGLIELLSYQMRDRLELNYYPHPYSVETGAHHDFIIVLSKSNLDQVVRHYAVKGRTAPPIIHINEPDVLMRIDHAALWPEVIVAPMPQSNVSNTTATTLNLSKFSEIIRNLEHLS
jgi:hypothetical protein